MHNRAKWASSQFGAQHPPEVAPSPPEKSLEKNNWGRKTQFASSVFISAILRFVRKPMQCSLFRFKLIRDAKRLSTTLVHGGANNNKCTRGTLFFTVINVRLLRAF